jgi:hypothetical protein
LILAQKNQDFCQKVRLRSDSDLTGEETALALAQSDKLGMNLEGSFMEPLEQQIAAGVRSLPTERQHEVLTFVEFLNSKVRTDSSTLARSQPIVMPRGESLSALEAAADLVGCLDGGPADLSTNRQYMAGFGES